MLQKLEAVEMFRVIYIQAGTGNEGERSVSKEMKHTGDQVEISGEAPRVLLKSLELKHTKI